MQLNHLNLVVSDMPAARTLFEELFDFEFLVQHGEAIAIFSDRHGFILALSNAARFGGETPRYPGIFHVGFGLEQPAEVDQAYDRVVAFGITPDHTPRKQHGTYGFYFRALDGVLFEVSSWLGE